jgi:hypothetical protein
VSTARQQGRPQEETSDWRLKRRFPPGELIPCLLTFIPSHKKENKKKNPEEKLQTFDDDNVKSQLFLRSFFQYGHVLLSCPLHPSISPHISFFLAVSQEQCLSMTS